MCDFVCYLCHKIFAALIVSHFLVDSWKDFSLVLVFKQRCPIIFIRELLQLSGYIG